MASLWQQYRALSPRTRIYIGLGGMAFALAGLYISDTMEDKLDPTKRQANQATTATSPDGSRAV
ncbi:hypothetical protein DFQ27_008411 [Actinomortierella ambigua]|uniref:Uncharacterized protein n=1 Tax=Actinomortierella ambigua TaxID=1343610 RepID=A0A9P6PQJ2_9FUNG|nr:hypothetical protein DFQ27_008411 [Actinomortierella ambigua]